MQRKLRKVEPMLASTQTIRAFHTTIPADHTSNATPSGLPMNFPKRKFFSAAMIAPSASIQPTLPVPIANISNMSAQQQPMQKTP